MESIYWVVSRDCNQRCPHCYNDSAPGAPGLCAVEVDQCLRHLPEPGDVPLDRIILSGGEVLVPLEQLFQSRGMVPANTIARGTEGPAPGKTPLVYAFWGATEDAWIGPLWPRGRARQKGLSKAGPEHRFCSDWSGAKNFLNYRGEGCEVNIQLAEVYPCCPMTCRPIGTLLDEPLLAMLDRCAAHPVYRALNEGRPEALGEALGISEEEGFRRSRELGNHCLWCDEFFTKHAPDMLHHGARTERGTVDLNVIRR